MSAIEGIVSVAKKAVDFTIQPVQGKLLSVGIDLSSIFQKGIEAVVGKKAMDNLANDIEENNKLKTQAYKKQAEAQLEFKRFQENVYNKKL